MPNDLESELIECLFLIPLKLNDKKKVAKSYFIRLENKLFENFDGYRAEGHVTGSYRMADGTRQNDELVKYVVALKRRELPKLKAILAQCALDLDQESIYFAMTNAHIDFIKNPEMQP